MTTGLRERKKADTRRAIADAALALAVERGPAAVTVDEIAAAADVSTRTVFNYFATKEDAILGFDPDRRSELLERLEARPSDESPIEALRQAMRGTTADGAVAWRTRARLARDHPQLQSAYIASFTKLEDELTRAIAHREGIDPGRDSYPRLVAATALTAMWVAVDHAIDHRRPDAIPAAVDHAFTGLAAGLPSRS